MASPTQRVDVRLPPGVRDFLPRATARRTKLADQLLGRFERWGYQRIMTPLFEVAGVIERGLGASAAQAAIRFIEPGGGDVALLRPDMTPQVARIAATRLHETGGPLRLCYQGTVVRESHGARRQREILQAGVELIGAPSPDGDAEMIALAAEVLRLVNCAPKDDCRLEVGHVGPAQALLAVVEDVDQRAEIFDGLVRRDLSSLSGATVGLVAPIAEALQRLPRLSGPLERLEKEAADLPDCVREALDEIRVVIDSAGELAPAALATIGTVVDLGEVGSFPYYTGIRVAGWMRGVGEAVLVGGRYDQLVARFGRDRKATGFAVNVEALAQAQIAAGDPPEAGSGILIAGRPERARQIAARLRTSGVRAAVELGGLRGVRAPARYADAAGLAAVLHLAERGAELVCGKHKTKLSEATVKKLLAGNRDALKTVRAALQGAERKR